MQAKKEPEKKEETDQDGSEDEEMEVGVCVW